MATESICYWLFDENCVCPRLHGYVGITRNPDKRREVYFKPWSKEGLRFEFLFQGTYAECQQMERDLRPHPNIGWNESIGGKPRVNWTPESRAKLSIALKGRRLSEEHRRKISASNMGRPPTKGRTGMKHSKETRIAISKANIGKRRTLETVQRIALTKIGNKYRLGKKHSDETRLKMSVSHTGKPTHSVEERKRRAERWKGNTLTKGKPWSAARRLAWLTRKQVSRPE